jgi:hypothetical protein
LKKTYRQSLVIFVLLAALLACNLQGGGDRDLEATALALSNSVLATATAQAQSEDNPQAFIPTAQAQATALVQSRAATQAAESILGEQSLTATAVVFAPILAELPKYGVDPARGRPAWIHPPVTIDIEGYMQYDYANDFIGTVAQDFVMSSDITWNTVTGLSGCGFVLRSDGNQDALNQYLVIATRGASGHVLFGTMVNGELLTGQDIYAYGIDPQFDWQNDSTNRLTVVGRGNQFTIYTNNTKLGDIDPSEPPPQPVFPPAPTEPPEDADQAQQAAYLAARAEYEQVVAEINATYRERLEALETADTQFERGFVAMVGLSESGRTLCQFNNTWLWLIEE